MNKKLVNFRIDEETWFQIKEISAKERRTIQELLTRNCEEYVKLHSNNPQYTMDDFEKQEQERIPRYNAPVDQYSKYFKMQTHEELQQTKAQLLLIEKQMMKFL